MAAVRLTYVITDATRARHSLRGQLKFLRARGYEVTLVADPRDGLAEFGAEQGVATRSVPMSASGDAAADAETLGGLLRVFRELRPHIVNARGPKAGVLGLLAARVCQVPARVYALRQIKAATARGFDRIRQQITERTAASSATRVLAASDSLRRSYLRQGFASPAKVTVVGSGSPNGVDVDRFAAVAGVQREAWRRHLGIPLRAPVIGFVGRFNRDAGLDTLVDAFDRISVTHGDAHLLLVGDARSTDPLPDELLSKIEAHPRVVAPGYVAEVMPYYAVMDVLANPSRREGFPDAPLEAAACGLPTAGSRCAGMVDAVRDGVTGTLVTPGDPSSLARALDRYLLEPSVRRRHGEAARVRVQRHFRPEGLWEALDETYRRLGPW